MVIKLSPELEHALSNQAQSEGIAPEILALNALRERFLPTKSIQPRDDWERRLLAIASDCKVTLSNKDLSSEGLYE